MTTTDGTAPHLGDIPPEEFRRQAQRVLQWIGDYLEHPDRYPVVPALEQVAGQLASRPGNGPGRVSS